MLLVWKVVEWWCLLVPWVEVGSWEKVPQGVDCWEKLMWEGVQQGGCCQAVSVAPEVRAGVLLKKGPEGLGTCAARGWLEEVPGPFQGREGALCRWR